MRELYKDCSMTLLANWTLGAMLLEQSKLPFMNLVIMAISTLVLYTWLSLAFHYGLRNQSLYFFYVVFVLIAVQFVFWISPYQSLLLNSKWQWLIFIKQLCYIIAVYPVTGILNLPISSHTFYTVCLACYILGFAFKKWSLA